MKKHFQRWLLGSLAVAGTMSASAALPTMTTDSNNPHYYLIENVRLTRDNSVTYATAPGATGQITLLTPTELIKDEGARYEIGSLWYFMACDGLEGVETKPGFTPVHIYNALTGQAIANVISGDWRVTGDDCVWYLTENSASLGENTYTGYSIVSQQDMNNNGYAWNNASGAGHLVEYWRANDPGSIWDFIEPESDKMDKTIQAIIDKRLPLAKAKGEELVQKGVNTAEAIADWNTAVSAVEDGDPTLEDYQNLVGAYINLQKSVKQVNINIKHKSHDYEYLGVDSSDAIKCIGNADDATVGQGTRAFTLFPTEGGFYLYNPYTNKYLKHPAADNTNASAVATQAEASIYNFDVWCVTTNDVSTTDGSLGIYEINTKPNRAYLHSNDASTNVVRWDFGSANSSWYVSVISDDEANAERIAGALHRANIDTNEKKATKLHDLQLITDEAYQAWTTALNQAKQTDATTEMIDALPAEFIKVRNSAKANTVNLQAQGRNNAFMGGDPSNKKISANANEGARTIIFEPATDGGFYIYSAYSGQYIVHPAATSYELTTTTNKADATVYAFDVMMTDGEASDNIGFFPITVANPNYNYLHAGGTKTIVQWEFSEPSSWAVSVINATDDEIAAERLAGAGHYAQSSLNAGKYLRELNICPDDVATAWDQIAAKIENGTATSAEYDRIADELFPALKNKVKNVSVTIQRKNNGTNYWAGTPDGTVNVKDMDTEGRQAMTLVPSDSGEGFHIYNEYTSKYIVFPEQDNVLVGVTENKADASVFFLDIQLNDGDNNYIGFHVSQGNWNFLNFNADAGLVRYLLDDAHSAWLISVIDDVQAAREHLNGAVNFLTIPDGVEIGENLGQYYSNTEAAQQLANDQNATAEELRAMAENLYGLNMPKAGRFYRLHYGNAYMNSELADNDRFSVAEQEESSLTNTTVFYYDGQHLVSFPEGLVLGNLETSTEGNLKGNVLNENSGKFEFVENPYAIGKYSLLTENGRYLHHQAAHIDSGTSLSNNTGYQWDVTEVSWLPIPHDGSEYISIYSPVALEKSYDRIGNHHGGSINQAKLEKVTRDESYIPANTPLIMEFKDGDGQISNGCVFLQLLYPSNEEVVLFADEDAQPASNDLAGHYLAQAKDSSKKYFTVNGTNFVEHTGDYIPGFQAHIAVDTENAQESYAISEPTTSGIDAIVAEKGDAVYDLQGRRLAAPAKGFNIINGRKVIVK